MTNDGTLSIRLPKSMIADLKALEQKTLIPTSRRLRHLIEQELDRQRAPKTEQTFRPVEYKKPCVLVAPQPPLVEEKAE